MAVGQWPGKNEDKSGIPFQGKLGKLTKEIVCGTLINPESIFWTNVLACRIPEDQYYNTKYGINCHDLLEQQINLVKPKLIIAIGRVSIARLTGRKAVKVQELAGTFGTYKGVKVFYMSHPAKIHRVDNKREQQTIREEIQEEVKIFHDYYRKLRTKVPNHNGTSTDYNKRTVRSREEDTAASTDHQSIGIGGTSGEDGGGIATPESTLDIGRGSFKPQNTPPRFG